MNKSLGYALVLGVALGATAVVSDAHAERNRYTRLQPGQSYYGYDAPYGSEHPSYRRVRRFYGPPAYFDYGVVRPYPYRYRFAPEYGYDDGPVEGPVYGGPGFY